MYLYHIFFFFFFPLHPFLPRPALPSSVLLSIIWPNPDPISSKGPSSSWGGWSSATSAQQAWDKNSLGLRRGMRTHPSSAWRWRGHLGTLLSGSPSSSYSWANSRELSSLASMCIITPGQNAILLELLLVQIPAGLPRCGHGRRGPGSIFDMLISSLVSLCWEPWHRKHTGCRCHSGLLASCFLHMKMFWSRLGLLLCHLCNFIIPIFVFQTSFLFLSFSVHVALFKDSGHCWGRWDSG